jgi:hypothetical protein
MQIPGAYPDSPPPQPPPFDTTNSPTPIDPVTLPRRTQKRPARSSRFVSNHHHLGGRIPMPGLHPGSKLSKPLTPGLAVGPRSSSSPSPSPFLRHRLSHHSRHHEPSSPQTLVKWPGCVTGTQRKGVRPDRLEGVHSRAGQCRVSLPSLLARH